MNQATRYVLAIYQVGLMIRDSFEYAIPKETYNKDFYVQRKAAVLHGMEEGAPLINFLSQNGETGQQIRGNVNDFIDLVYGEESRVASLDGDTLVVDPALAPQLLDYIVGLHETISDVIRGFADHSKTNGQYEEDLGELIEKDEKFYRSLACLVLTDTMHRQFIEYNRARNEAKGEETPQSNFVLNDLKKTIGFYRFVQQHSKITDERFTKNVEATEHVLNCMSAKEQVTEGADLRTLLNNLHEEWTKYVQVAELDWRKIYVQIWQDLVAFEKDLQKSATNTEKSN